MFWSLKLGTRPQGGESGGPILEFGIYLGFGAWDLGFGRHRSQDSNCMMTQQPNDTFLTPRLQNPLES